MKRRAATTTRPASNLRQQFGRQHHFRPRFEPLEDRRMLSIGATLTDYMPMFVETATDSPIVVSTLLDENDGDYSAGDLSLREALILAADETSYPGADEITFDATLFAGGPATITLDGTELTLDSDVTIDGPGAELLAIDADGRSRVFSVSESITATIDGLTITGGLADEGGGIYSEGTLTVVSSTLVGNSATGQYGYGGGIYSALNSVLTVTGCTFSGNSAVSDGGGIYNNGMLTVTGCTFAGNSAERYGGGIRRQNGTLTVTNSIAVLNESLSHEDVSGALHIGSGFNLIGVDPGFVRNPSDGGDGWGDDPDTPDVDESANDDYGDLHLTAYSAAVDAGNNALLPADALDLDNDGDTSEPLPYDLDGNPRVYGTSVDCGAFEFQSGMAAGRETPSVTVTTAEDTFDLYDQQISLREAIWYADPDSVGTTVTFDPALDDSTITLQGTSLRIDKSMVIDASALTSLTIDAAEQSGVLSVVAAEDAEVELAGLTITGGSAYQGGGIYNAGTLTVTGCTFSGNSAEWNGGGIYNSGTLTVIGSTLSGNSAERYGGGINNGYRSALTVIGSTLSGNSATGQFGSGGGIYGERNSTLTVRESTFSGNSAETGGGIRSYGTLTLNCSAFSGNSAKREGGGIYSYGTLTVTGGTFSDNSAEWDGGGIYSSGTLTVTGGTFSDNSAERDGGGIYSSGTLTVIGSTLSGNSAVSDGGGICNEGMLTVIGSTLSGNSAVWDGGGIYGERNSTLTVRESTFSGNSATGQFGSGGGIRNEGTLTLNCSAFSGNSAEHYGGGIYNSGTLTVTGSTLSGNSATGQLGSGGGIYSALNDTLTVIGSTLSGNSAVSDGGGICNEGMLTVIGSMLSGNSAETGGGICSYRTLTVTSSTLSGNSAEQKGGGIYNYRTSTVTSSTLSGNSAGNDGGGIYNRDTLTVTGSTLSGNSATGQFGSGGGIYNFVGCTLVVTNSIVSLNDASSRPNISGDLDGNSGFNLVDVDPGFLRNPSDGGNGWGDNPDTPHVDESANDDYGDLRILRDSPAVDTGNNALLPADTLDLDNDGDTSEPIPFDLGGSPRIFNGTVDIGAYEYQLSPPTGSVLIAGAKEFDGNPDTLDSPSLRIDPQASDASGPVSQMRYRLNGQAWGNWQSYSSSAFGVTLSEDVIQAAGGGPITVWIQYCDTEGNESEIYSDSLDLIPLTVTTLADTISADGALSLREALLAAPLRPDEAINFAPTLFTSGPATICLGGSELRIEHDLEIEGPGAELLIIDADGRSRVFFVGEDVTATIDGLTITGGSADDGGGIYSEGTLTIVNSTLVGNSATGQHGYGGGVYSSGMLTVTGSALVGNSAVYYGGGIYNRYGSTSMVTGSTVVGNFAERYGGGISNQNGTLTVTNSIVALNEALSHEDVSGALGSGSGSNVVGINPGFVRNPSDGGDGWGDDPDTPDVDESANDDYGDLHLTAYSAAVDAGNNALLPADALDVDNDGDTSEPLPYDLDGNPRVYGTSVDCGAFEFQSGMAAGRETPSVTVTTTEDTFDLYDQQISLREAIWYADPDSVGTTVTFDPALDDSTITLQGTSLRIDKSMVIDASALSSLTLDAARHSRVLSIAAAADEEVELAGLTITGGSAAYGGGIYNAGTLTVTGCTISGNSAETYDGGGISNAGTLTVTGSTLSDNWAKWDGGGIFNTGALTVTGSAFSGNTAMYNGGGIYGYYGTLTVTGSTLFGNSAGNDGGGVDNSRYSTLTMTDCALVGNSAGNNGGGIYNYDGTLTVTCSTLSGNAAMHSGGGIYNDCGTLTLTNSIIALSTAPSGPNISGALETGSGFNLIGVDPSFVRNPSDGGDGWGDDPDTPDVDESANDDYGDLHLRLDSPAVDAGDNSLLPADELDLDNDGDATEPLPVDFDGNPRVVNGSVDIGAYERKCVTELIVSTLVDENDGDYSVGDLSLREALSLAADEANYPGADEITFDASLFTDGSATITLDASLGQLEIDGDAKIQGPGAEQLAIDADSSSRVFLVNDDVTATISGLTITGGRADSGGGVFSYGTLTISDAVVSGNTAFDELSGRGGGVANREGELTIINSTISNNAALKGDSFSGKGGGIYGYGGTIAIVDSVISGNSATGTCAVGGGVYSWGTLTIEGSTLSGNISGGTAGGMCVSVNADDAVSITDTEFLGNSANSGGGALSVSGGTFSESAVCVVSNATFANNTAQSGGAIYVYETGLLKVISSHFLRNAVADNNYSYGGGIYSKGTLDIVNSVFVGNTVRARESEGGAIYNAGGTLSVASSTIAGNSAERAGGGISNEDGQLTVVNSIVALNSAPIEANVDGVMTSESRVNLIDYDPSFVENPGDGGDGWGDDPDTADVDESLNDNFGDLHLRDNSLAIEMGDYYLLPADIADLDQDGDVAERLPLDIDGNPRVFGGIFGHRLDVGTYEYQQEPAAEREAASAVVTTLDDTIDPTDGEISLREAIFYADRVTPRSAVTFHPALDGGVIVLDGTAVSLNQAVTIDASALNSLTVNANGQSRVFDVTGSGNAQLIGLTITGGVANAGGGIRNLGVLTIDSSTISNNTALGTWREGGGGIYNLGELTIVDSLIAENSAPNVGHGGGIYNAATTTITNSTLSGNWALGKTSGDEGGSGGAIYNDEDCVLTVTNSSLVGNWTSGMFANGAGIRNYFGTVTVVDSILAGNAASGERSRGAALYTQQGDATLINSTVTGNSAKGEYASNAGIYNRNGSLVLQNSIVALNTATSNPDVGGTWEGNGIVGTDPLFSRNPSDGGDGWADDPDTPNVDESANNDYGDLHLRAGSPAIDAGDNSLLPADEFDLDDDSDTSELLPIDLAGDERIVGATVDMGAYEGAVVAELVVSTLIDENDGDYSDGDLSLREAIALAATYAYDQVITFSPDLFVDGSRTIVLDATLGQLEYDAKNSAVDGKVTIEGPGADLLTIDADGNNRVFAFIGSEAKLEGLTITGGVASGWGGGVYADNGATVEIVACTIAKNSTSGSGGGIRAANGTTLVLTDAVISDNHSGTGGGGISVFETTCTMTNTVITGNTGSNGGGVYALYSAVTLTNATVVDNTAENGGGVYGSGVSLDLINSTVAGNSAEATGGGIYSNGQSFTVTNSTIAHNVANDGGGIYVKAASSTATLNNTIVARNTSHDAGPNIRGELSGSNNLIGDGTGQTSLVDGVDGNMVGTAESPIDPLLSDITQFDNGHWGYLLLSESPAIDAGDNALAVDEQGHPLADDLAGNPRIENDIVDIGAVEGAATLTEGQIYIVTSLANVIDANDGQLTFIEAFQAANSNRAVGDAPAGSSSELDTIRFADGLAGTVVVDGGQLAIAGKLSIEGPGADMLTFDAQGENRVFYVQTGAEVALSEMTITGGQADDGGGIYSNGTLAIARTTISDNVAANNGGGIYNRLGVLTVTDCTLSGNVAGADGGAIHDDFGMTAVANSLIAANSAGDTGGGIFATGTVTVGSSTIACNSAENDGGGIYSNSILSIYSSIVALNRADNGANVSGTLTSESQFNLIDVDPQFVSAASAGEDGIWHTDDDVAGDYRLSIDSPAIDAGSNALAVDADGNPLLWDIRGEGFDRVVNWLVDIGAYENEDVVVTEYYFVGTDGDDTFEFTAGATAADWVVKVNGVEQIFPDTVEQIFFDGREGNDQVTLIGTDGADTAVLEATAAELSGSGYAVFTTNVENPTVYGRAGEDTITFYDNAGRNQFVAGRGFAGYLTGFAGELRSYEFELVTAYATDGIDEAKLYDSAGDDVFVSDPNVSTLTGGGMTITVHDFQGVHAYATLGGTDKAYFTDTALDDQVIGTHEYAIMWSPNYEQGVFNRSKFFEESYAVSSQGGADIVKFYDGPGDDVFVADEHEASFTCVNKYTTSSVYVEDFVGVHAFASTGTGYDTATFYDSTGNDEYYSDAVQAALWNTSAGWYNRAKFFERTDAYATAGGTDKATLYDSTFDDNLLLDANSLTIYGADNGHHFGTSFRNRIELFDTVYAKSIGGTDVLELEDSNGADTLEANGHQLSFFSAEHNLDYVLEDIAQTTAKTDDNNTDTRKVLDYLFDIDFEGRWRNAP